MSLSSPDRFVAVLGAQGVGFGQRHGNRLDWQGSVGFIAERSQAWTVALDTLQCLLAERTTKGGQLSLVLSAHYCRFCLVPWSAAISRPQEFEDYARACFEAHYGLPLQGWKVVVSSEAAGKTRLAAALPEALLERAAELCRQAGLKLRSVQPYLMTAFNRFLCTLERDDFLFLLAEPQRSVLLLARDGEWQQVRSQGSADSDAALGALLARECELQAGEGAAPANLYLHAPGRSEPRPQLDGVTLCELPGEALPVQDLLRSMARAVA